jgi:hypothetical protein
MTKKMPKYGEGNNVNLFTNSQLEEEINGFFLKFNCLWFGFYSLLILLDISVDILTKYKVVLQKREKIAIVQHNSFYFKGL